MKKLENSTVYQVACVVCDIVLIGLLWLLCSIPILTIGTASATAFHTMQMVVIEGKGTTTKTFIKSLRSNLKAGVLCGVPMLILVAAIIYLIHFMVDGNTLDAASTIILTFSFIFFVTLQTFLYSLIGQFNLTMNQSLYLATRVLLCNPLLSIATFLFWGALTLLVVIYPPLICLLPGAFFYFSVKTQMPVYLKYIRIV